MTDHPTLEQLNDLVDDATDHAVAGHVADCAVCTRRVTDLRGVVLRARRLPSTIDPPPALWNDIRETIERHKVVPIRGVPRTQPSIRRVAPTLAAAVALVIVTAAITVRLTRGSDLRRSADTAPASPLAASGGTVTLAAIERSYRPTLDEMTAALAVSRAKLAPATLERIDRNLRVIDDAIAEVRDALLQDPNNAALARILSATYRQKIDLLRRANEWAPTS